MASSEQESTSSKTTFGYGRPTDAGKIPFTPPGTDRECETAYWLWGDPTGPVAPLIVLHGGPGAPGRDLQALAVLHDRHRIPVLLYDQIGCGASTHLRDLRGDTTFWTDALFIAEVDNLRKHFKIKTFDLFGHSCGGMLAILYTLTQPRGLRKLVIASSVASDPLRLQAYARNRAGLPQEMQDTMAACEKEGRTDDPKYKEVDAEFARRHLCRMDPWPAEMKEVMALMEEDDTVPHTLYGTTPFETTGSRKTYNPIPRLPEITETTVPGGVLLTNGRYDMVPDYGMTPLFTQISARVKWVRFADSAHFPHLEENEAYLEALGDFLTMPVAG